MGEAEMKDQFGATQPIPRDTRNLTLEELLEYKAFLEFAFGHPGNSFHRNREIKRERRRVLQAISGRERRARGVKHRSVRPSYKLGVEWIAFNDEPLETDPEAVGCFISTLLLADLFGKEPGVVALDIVRLRKKEMKYAETK